MDRRYVSRGSTCMHLDEHEILGLGVGQEELLVYMPLVSVIIVFGDAAASGSKPWVVLISFVVLAQGPGVTALS